MARQTDLFSLWIWPWELVRANLALAETMIAAPGVVAARLPTIGEAIANPWTADHRELNLMVTEKVDAFGLSHASVTSAARKLKAVSEANARDLGRLSGGMPLWPADWIRIAERNLDLVATLASLPGRAVAPIHRTATANARRLRSEGQSIVPMRP